MKKKLPPGTRGKLVLRSIPSPQVEARVTALLVRLVKRVPAERIQGIVRNPPVVLFKNLSVEKGRKLISALEKAGALAVFVPHRPAEAKRLKQPSKAPRVVETPITIVPPPGRLRRKWLRILATAVLLLCSAVALTVSLFPMVRPEGLFRPPVPPHADLSGFRPVPADVPAVADVGAADMPAVVSLQYRPGPDLRFIDSFRIIAERYPLFSGMAASGFSIGAVETDGKRVRVPVLESGAPFWELNLTLPVEFETGMAACRALLPEILKTEVKGLEAMKDDPELAVKHPQLLKQLKQGAGIDFNEGTVIKPDTVNVSFVQNIVRQAISHTDQADSDILDIKNYRVTEQPKLTNETKTPS